jgi:2-haloacid dehalogenase
VTLTNSVREVAEEQLTTSGLRGLVDAVYSADEVQRLKPALEPYRMVLEQEREDAAVLVAAHDWDVACFGRLGSGSGQRVSTLRI